MSEILLCCLLVSMFGALCYAGRLIMKEDQFVQSIKDEHKTLLLTVNAQRKDIEDYLEKIKVLLENNKIITSSATRQLKEKQERIEELECKAREIQEGYLSEVKRNNSIKTDLKLARDTIRKLNRRAQKAESELIKSQKYHKNTKTYFKDRLEWSLEGLEKVQNLVRDLGKTIDYQIKFCNPFEKKEAELPQSEPKNEVFEPKVTYEPGELLTADSKGNLIKVEAEDTIRGEGVDMRIWQVQKAVNQSTPWIKITTPVPPEAQSKPYDWSKKGWSTFATVKQEGDSMVMHKETK